MFSWESPHRGDSKDYVQYAIFNMKMNIILNYPKFAAIELFLKGLKNEFETAVVNEPPVCEPLKDLMYREKAKNLVKLRTLIRFCIAALAKRLYVSCHTIDLSICFRPHYEFDKKAMIANRHNDINQN